MARQKRMSPVHQSAAREELAQKIANVTTGDKDIDALTHAEVRRRETFAIPSRSNSKPAPVGFRQALEDTKSPLTPMQRRKGFEILRARDMRKFGY